MAHRPLPHRRHARSVVKRAAIAPIALFALIFSLIAGSASAMAPQPYQALRAQVKRTAFAKDRLDVVRIAASGNVFTSQQVRGLIAVFSFSSGKLKALRQLSPRIVDPANSFVILNAFTFSSDKKKAAKILRRAGSGVQVAPPPPQPSQPRYAPPPPQPSQPRYAPPPPQPRRYHGHHGPHGRAVQPAPPPHPSGPHAHYSQRNAPAPMPRARPLPPAPQPQVDDVPRRGPPPRRGPGAAAPYANGAYPSGAGWAVRGYGHVRNAWPRRAMKRLRRTLRRASFSRDKLAALRLAVNSRHEGLTAKQVRKILKAFGFSRDMVAALRIMEPKILAMPARDVAKIISKYPFSRDRIEVLKALKHTILDLQNRHIILAAFTFSHDKATAARILARVRPRSPLYGTITGRHVVFVIDTSGSMAAEVFTTGGRRVNRLDYVRYELRRALRALPPGATFNIVVFAGGVLRWQPRGVLATPANIRQAMRFMAYQRPEGTTNIWDALATALREPAVDEVHFLTDGTPTAGPVRGYNQVLRRFRSLLPRHPVRVHGAALLMGRWQGDRKGKSAQLVCGVASQTGGLCRVMR